MRTTVIFEGPPGVVVTTPEVEVIGATADELVATAERATTAGAERIELCGGVGATHAAAVTGAVAGRAAVGLVRYDFDSLEAITDYKRAFAAGRDQTETFVYLTAAATDGPIRTTVGSTTVVGIADPSEVAVVAAAAAERGDGLIELYAGLGVVAAGIAATASQGRVPIGFVGYDA